MNPETAATAAKLNNPRTIRAWYMYDWANSVYTLVITTAVFPIYYKAKAVMPGGSDQVNFLGATIQNSVLYTYALSFSFLVVASLLPLLSGAADYTGKKKNFMKVFVWLGALSCMGLYLFDGVDTLGWAIFCSITASIGYSGSLVFYDAFLPEIVTPDRYDITSARGYSMGFYGSVILMVICMVLILNYQTFGFASDAMATRFSFILTGLWWIGFSMIPFSILPDNPYNRKPSGNIWTKGYHEIRSVWNTLPSFPDMRRYLTAFFFYNMGVQSVMYLATLFGTDVLHLATDDLILIVVIIQIVGALGAVLFARISRMRGNRFTLMIMIGVWVGVCIAAYYIQTKYQFFALAFVVGLIMGGIQSLSRSTFSKLIPHDTTDHTSYFSFYDVTFNLSIVLGTFTYGFIDHITGSMRYSALALAVFFIIGFCLLFTVKAKIIRRPGLLK